MTKWEKFFDEKIKEIAKRIGKKNKIFRKNPKYKTLEIYNRKEVL